MKPFAVALCLVLSACAPVGVVAQGSSPQPSPSSKLSDYEKGPAITLAQFDSLKEGMTYPEVSAIFGRGSEEPIVAEYVPGTVNEIRQWLNPTSVGGVVTLTFVNGKLKAKDQQGIK